MGTRADRAMKLKRMYDELAHLWRLISPPEDYADEARYWRDALRAKLGSGRHEILELGVGGGNNLSHLTSEFQATAVDLSEANKGVGSLCFESVVFSCREKRLPTPFMALQVARGRAEHGFPTIDGPRQLVVGRRVP